MAFIDERLGSGDFDDGPDGGSGQILFYIVGAADQDEAKALAEADPRAPADINGFQRGRVKASHVDGPLYHVDIDYKRGIPGAAQEDAGQSPPGQQTPGQDPNSALSRDVSFSTGGATRKIFYSIATIHALSAGGGDAPDFGGLIGVDVKGGKVEGAEIIAPGGDVTVTKRFPLLTVGWFRYMLSKIATTNDGAYRGMDRGEWLFCGCDGQYKDGDKATIGGQQVDVPWTVTGRFKFSPNKTFEDSPKELTLRGIDGEIQIPTVGGHEWVWVMYAEDHQTITVNGQAQEYIVQMPKFVYVEQCYEESDFFFLDLE